MNSSKNKLNSKIILIFHPNSNTHYASAANEHFSQPLAFYSKIFAQFPFFSQKFHNFCPNSAHVTSYE